MKDIKGRRLVLMITDSSGSRYINIHAIFKELSLYFALTIATLVLFGAISLRTLNAEITEITELNDLILKRYESILATNAELSRQVTDRMEEIELVSGKIEDLEGIVGIQNDGGVYENIIEPLESDLAKAANLPLDSDTGLANTDLDSITGTRVGVATESEAVIESANAMESASAIESATTTQSANAIESATTTELTDSNQHAHAVESTTIHTADSTTLQHAHALHIPYASPEDPADSGLAHRVDAASLTGVQKSFTLKMIPNGLPLENYRRISADYGKRVHPIMMVKHFHTGLDFSAPIGTAVYATADGVVDFASSGYNGGYGKLIKIEHFYGFRTYYAHLDKVLVKRGEFVKKGQIIGHSGNSGVSTGPHLHYEVRFLGNILDPKNFVRWTMSDFYTIFTRERSVSWPSLLTKINSLMEAPTHLAARR